MKKISLLLLVLCGLVAAVGCNTLRGMGRDVEDAGDAVQDATR